MTSPSHADGTKYLRNQSRASPAILSIPREVAKKYLKDSNIRDLRDRFWELLQKNFVGRVLLNGHPTHRLPNTLNVSFVGKIGGEILSRLDGVAASTDAACHSGSVEISPVLKAMGVSPEAGMGAVRFSLGRTTTLEELDAVVQLLRKALPLSAAACSPAA